MIALLVNAASILVGSLIGLALRKKFSDIVMHGIMIGIGICVVFMGVTSLDASVSSIPLFLAFALSGAIGYRVDLEGKINAAGEKLEKKLVGEAKDNGFAGACIGFFLMSCMGAYTLNASFEAGMGDNTMLYTKAIIDLIVSMSLSASLGIGVLFAFVPICAYEGLLILLAGWLMPLMSNSMVGALSCAGALITMVIGCNMIGATKIKAVNFVPAVIFAPLLTLLIEKIA